MALIIEIADDLAAFEALEADWRELFSLSATDNYFVSYDWCKIWWDTFGGPAGSQPVLVTVRSEGRLVALLPLSVWRTGPRSAAEAMGGETGHCCDRLVAPGMAGGRNSTPPGPAMLTYAPYITPAWTPVLRRAIATVIANLVSSSLPSIGGITKIPSGTQATPKRRRCWRYSVRMEATSAIAEKVNADISNIGRL